MPTLSSFWSHAVRLTGRLDLSGVPIGTNPERLSRDALVAHGVRPRHASALTSDGPELHAGQFVRWSDSAYPDRLRRVPHAPPVLFHEGDLERLREPGVAIVGARRCSTEGRRMARELARAVSRAEGTVISGLAQGIDSEAHAASQGRTIAVLGQGLSTRLPGARERLRRRILDDGGLILSELPPERPASRITFPMRNRIIAGLSRVTVVVEARERSGSRITARNALEAGRDVMAVPGHPSQELARGCLTLLREGAGLVTEPADVLEAAGLEACPAQPTLDPVLSAMGRGTDFEGLLARTGLGTQALLRRLARLELDGHIERLPGGWYGPATR